MQPQEATKEPMIELDTGGNPVDVELKAEKEVQVEEQKEDKVEQSKEEVGKEVKKLVELSQLMAEAMPEYAKKLPKKELPNFMVKLISYLDSSAKTMKPDLGIVMQTDTAYAEELF